MSVMILEQVEDAAPVAAPLAARYQAVRAATAAIAAGLSDEDCLLQSMPDASPLKWHLAHGSWFFETFVLTANVPGYTAFDPAFAVLFNSYYVAIGERHPRGERGMLSRPSRGEVMAYRTHVDTAMARLLAANPDDTCRALVELGLQHEQQHQELMWMDILHAFSRNPLHPACAPQWRAPAGTAAPARRWHAIDAGLYRIGHPHTEAGRGFAFDNETPAHRVWLEDYRIADRLVTAGAYRDFIADGGYRRPELWLSDGFATAGGEGWTAPLYWRRDGDAWLHFTPAGLRPIDPDAAVLHVSYYEADAFARWAGARLPTEAEWEVAAPRLAQASTVGWQWTASAYSAYPGFQAAAGAVGEYNGKFMINQQVLRGGSWATPAGHARATYRNFFTPGSRWMVSAIRLANQG